MRIGPAMLVVVLACAPSCGDDGGGNNGDSDGAPPIEPPSSLTSSDETVSFPETSIGDTSDAVVVTVTNDGDGGTGAITAELSGAGSSAFAVTGCDAAVDAGDSCELSVTFTPDAGGIMAATLTVSAEGGGSVEIALSGEESHNLAFISSVDYPSNLGGYAAYDAKCNELATAAGLPNPEGSSYVAWVSDSTSNAIDRLGTARGFVRVDGVPFADLIQANYVFNPLNVDESGEPAYLPGTTVSVYTGTIDDGTAYDDKTCEDWTTNNSGTGSGGNADSGPHFFTASFYGACTPDKIRPIYCLQRTKDAALEPAAVPGTKLIYLSQPFTPNPTTSPDEACEAARPAGYTTIAVKALVSTQSVPASTFLADDAVYARLDHTVVGTGAEIKANGSLRSNVWQDKFGAYLTALADVTVWTGAGAPTETGSAPQTCDNWSDSGAGNGLYSATYQTRYVWRADLTRSCDEPARLVCVEQ